MNVFQRNHPRPGLRGRGYRTPRAQTPTDLDADLLGLAARLPHQAPRHGFWVGAWAALRHDEGREDQREEVHRLWREGGATKVTGAQPAQAGRGRPRCPPELVADAPKVVWAIDFQFDCTVDGKRDQDRLDGRRTYPRVAAEHRGASSITGERLVERARRRTFAAAGGPPRVLRMDNGPELVSQALHRFLRRARAACRTSRRARPWSQRATSNRSATTAYARSASTATTGTPCSGSACHRRLQAGAQPPTPALGRGLAEHRPSTLPDAGTPTIPWPARSTEPNHNNPALTPGGLSIGDSSKVSNLKVCHCCLVLHPAFVVPFVKRECSPLDPGFRS